MANRRTSLAIAALAVLVSSFIAHGQQMSTIPPTDNNEALIDAGVNPDVMDREGKRSVDYAVERGRSKSALKVLRLLYRAGAGPG